VTAKAVSTTTDANATAERQYFRKASVTNVQSILPSLKSR
jgi:hypothetical protein